MRILWWAFSIAKSITLWDTITTYLARENDVYILHNDKANSQGSYRFNDSKKYILYDVFDFLVAGVTVLLFGQLARRSATTAKAIVFLKDLINSMRFVLTDTICINKGTDHTPHLLTEANTDNKTSKSYKRTKMRSRVQDQRRMSWRHMVIPTALVSLDRLLNKT